MAGALAGLYVHLPFCSAICPYCDFYVLTGNGAAKSELVDLLLLEAGSWGERWTAGPFDTVYLGGGTPSALSPALLARLLAGLRERLPLTIGARLLMEANPEDVTPEALQAWRELGVATLSLGVQALDDARLRFLGRRHDVATARLAVELAVAGGFETVSIDLIYGMAGQRPGQWRAELAAAVALGPRHLSCYQLTIHPGTPFGFRRARGRLAELPEEAQGELFRITHRWLGERGWDAYEVSSFAVAPHHRSPHNLKYWSHTPYLGIGPSAHSFADGRRWWNLRTLPRWRERLLGGRLAVDDEEILGSEQLALEVVMLGLRTAAGIALAPYRERFGVDLLEVNRQLVDRLAEQGLWRLEDGCLRPTIEGMALADALARALRVG